MDYTWVICAYLDIVKVQFPLCICQLYKFSNTMVESEIKNLSERGISYRLNIYRKIYCRYNLEIKDLMV